MPPRRSWPTPSDVSSTGRSASSWRPAARRRRARPSCSAPCPPDRRDRLQLGPLPLAALHQLFLARFGRSFPRLALVRIEEASGGNPFYALEIARALGDGSIGPELAADWRVPIPDTLGGLVEARLAALPEATRSALLLVAVAAEPTIDGLRRADPDAPDALGPAFDAGVATMDRRAVRFTHPLLGQAVLSGADGAALQRAHAALARTATSDEVRARHLAGATEGRDPDVAAALEAAAATIRDRGATLDAAALYERSAALTPETDPDGAMRRARLAAETLFIDISDYVQADRILEAAIAGASPGPERAEALSLRALIRYYHGQTPDAIRLGERAVEEAGDDPIVRARVMGRTAFLVMQLDLERGNAMVADALALLGSVGDGRHIDPDLRANLLLLHASSELGLVRAYPADEADEGTSPLSGAWPNVGARRRRRDRIRARPPARPDRSRDRDDRATHRGQGRPGRRRSLQPRLALGSAGAPRRPRRGRGICPCGGRGLRPRGRGRLPGVAAPGHRPRRGPSRATR